MALLKWALPKPPLPPRSNFTRCAVLGQIGDQGLAVFLIDLRSDRHLHHRVGAIGAGHHLALAAFAALGLHMLLEAVVDQGVEIVHRLGPDIAALAAIAAIGTAIFDELLPAERNAAIAASAAGGIDLRDVEKSHRNTLQAACFRRKSARVNSISWHSTLRPRARQSRIRLPLWRAPSLASTWPEAGLS